MNARRRLGRDVAVYGLSTVLVQVTAVVTMPVYTRALGPAGYGVLELLTVTVSFVITALFEGMGIAALRLYFTEAEEDRPSLLSTGLFSTVGVTIAGAAVAVAAAHPVARALLGTSSAATAVTAAAIYLPLGVAARYTAEILRMQQRPWPYLVSSVLAAGVGAATAVVLVVAADEGVRGVYWGLTAGAVAALLTNLVLAGRALALRFSGAQLRRLLAFGGPLVLSALGGWSLVLVDRVILAQFVNLREVGFYGLANRLAGVLLIGTYAFGTAWTPYILALHSDNPEAEARIRADVLRHWVAAMAALAVLVAALSREVVEIVAGASFVPAADVIPTLALGCLLFASLTVTQTPFLIESRTGDMAGLSVAAAVVNIAACFVLIPPWGIHGAAVATVLGFAFQAGAYYHRAQRLLPAPYAPRHIAAALVLALPFMALGWVEVDPLALGVALKGAAVLVYAGLLVALRIVDVGRLRSELKMVFSG